MIPLPSETTLQEWTRNFICRPGILPEVLHIMRTRSTQVTPLQRLCVLCFDEINVDARISYDKGLDQIFGSLSNVQVVMVRGLAHTWKQPIYSQLRL